MWQQGCRRNTRILASEFNPGKRAGPSHCIWRPKGIELTFKRSYYETESVIGCVLLGTGVYCRPLLHLRTFLAAARSTRHQGLSSFSVSGYVTWTSKRVPSTAAPWDLGRILRHAFSDALRLTNFGYPHVRAAGLHGDT